MDRSPTVALLLLVAACSPSDSPPAPTSRPAGTPVTQNRTESLGDRLSAEKFDLVAGGVREGPALAVQDVLHDPDGYAGRDLRIAGEVVSVCQVKGCWFRLGSARDNLFVKFAGGCSELMPKDAAGRQVLVEGKLVVEKVSVAERKHLLEDQGKHAEAEAVTAPATEVRLVATGAALRKG